MKTINLFIASAGRRGYIVDFFKESLSGNGIVHVGNSDLFASSLHHGDVQVITPLIYSEEYIPFLLDYCRTNDINVIISLFDADMGVLAKNRKNFEENGIRLIVSDERTVLICNDKWKTYNFFVENNINTPKTYLSIDNVINAISEKKISFPIIIKPRWGCGSIAIFTAYNEEELKTLSDLCKRMIIDSYLKYESEVEIEESVIYQEMINGQEYGMDIINDLDGKYKTHVIRKKIAMRSGETDIAMIIDDRETDRFKKIIDSIEKGLKHIANMDVDLIEGDDGLYAIEMNARFGGGYPFSHAAGVDLPSAIIKWLQGEDVGDELTIDRYGELLCKEINVAKI